MRIVVVKILLLVLVFLHSNIFAQPDLEVTSTSFYPLQVNKSGLLNIEIDVENTGFIPAVESYVNLYISEDLFFEESEKITRVTLEDLEAGEITTLKIKAYVPNHIDANLYFVGYRLDSENDVVELNENNNYYDPTPLEVTSVNESTLKLPYPIIMVHGLLSDSKTWDPLADALDSLYGMSYGGVMNICLNSDFENTISDWTADIFDHTSPNDLTVGDYYLLNFDVDPFGTPYYGDEFDDPFESNQSAIYKQGIALNLAIEHVKSVTGSDKVILLGHSMGGLASREYLQNPDKWVSSAEHYVAKLATIATPHGGSNSSAGPFAMLNNYNDYGEATRDLRRTYPGSVPGAYLFGGVEDSSIVTGVFFHYVNTDIDCNGDYGDLITGLNEKSFPTDVDFRLSLGTGSSINGGDGVVSMFSGDVNNFLEVEADTFIVDSFVWLYDGILHTKIQGIISVDMNTLDEPYRYGKSYEISLDEIYTGYCNTQSKTHLYYPRDYDDYYFIVDNVGRIDIELSNIPTHNFQVDLYDSSFDLVISLESDGNGSLEYYNIPVTPGKYYLELHDIPEKDSWMYPYFLKIPFTQDILTSSTDDQQLLASEELKIIGTVVSDGILNYESDFDGYKVIQVNVLDAMGKVVFERVETNAGINHELKLPRFAQGAYFLRVKKDGGHYSAPFFIK